MLRLRPTHAVGGSIEQWRAHASAFRFHLREPHDRPLLLAILGGTGTGKSTLVNGLVGAELSATSFRRTFTNGPVAIAGRAEAIPAGWLGIDVHVAEREAVPVRGEAGRLVLVPCDHPLTARVSLIDTPDLDGDQPSHYAVADLVFRWADAVLFVVTPEKYQMTEWPGYARLARRYRLPAIFVMNKCENSAVVEDFRDQLDERGWAGARVFAVPRDDAAYEPSREIDLGALREAVSSLEHPGREQQEQALRHRRADLVDRLRDRILSPLRTDRRRVDRLAAALRSLRIAVPGVDVSPVTQQLRRRMQEQSVLYLMGPQRVLERVRQVPAIVARLPRTTWDFISGSPRPSRSLPNPHSSDEPALPDFSRLLRDQFVVLQSRIDDVIRSEPGASDWVESEPESYRGTRMDPARAAQIVEEELADLRAWLEQRRDAAPRDTRMVQSLLKYLPGGRKVVKLSETAPYLLTLIVAAHGAMFGHIDLLIIGGFSLAVWLGEKLSNEVTVRTRRANDRIGERFERLAGEQVERVCAWLDGQAPASSELDRLDELADRIAAAAG